MWRHGLNYIEYNIKYICENANIRQHSLNETESRFLTCVSLSALYLFKIDSLLQQLTTLKTCSVISNHGLCRYLYVKQFVTKINTRHKGFQDQGQVRIKGKQRLQILLAIAETAAGRCICKCITWAGLSGHFQWMPLAHVAHQSWGRPDSCGRCCDPPWWRGLQAPAQ